MPASPCVAGQLPGHEDGQRRLQELARLQAQGTDPDPAPGTVDLDADDEGEHEESQEDEEQHLGQTHHAQGVEQRAHEQEQCGGCQEEHVADEEVHVRTVLLHADGRARGQDQDRRRCRPGWRCRSAARGRSSTTSCRRASGWCGRAWSWGGSGGSTGEGAEGVATGLEIRELVVGGTGRCQQHHALRETAPPCRLGGGRQRHVQAAGALDRDDIAQIGLDLRLPPRRSGRRGARRPRCGRRLAKPPGLGRPPAIQKMSGKGVERPGGSVGVGGLAVVDEADAIRRRHLLQPVRQPDEARQT